MSRFKNHSLSTKSLLESIPKEIFSDIGTLIKETNVDHYVKVLRGQTLFNLLLYGLLESDRLSLRTLEDAFNSPEFKILFDMDFNQSIRHSSISERLSKVNPEFFRQIYLNIYSQLTTLYGDKECENFRVVSVDSSIVYESSQSLVEGFKYNQSNKKAVKSTISFDGLFPCGAMLFTAPTYASESNAMPEAVLSNIDQQLVENPIFILDRGLSSVIKMVEMYKAGAKFIARISENRKHKEIEHLPVEIDERADCVIIKDVKIRLYSQKLKSSIDSGVCKKDGEVPTDLRLVVVQSKSDSSKEYWFVTNSFDLTAYQVAAYYRRRWDIEVFFRFIKQELNFSHFVSLNRNGIEVMLYMTMITSMLLLIYKKYNNIGYKTAKRRFTIEMRELIISEIVKRCGGDPSIVFNSLE